MSEKLARAKRMRRIWLIVAAIALALYLILHHIGYPLDFIAGWVTGIAWCQVFTIEGWIDGYRSAQRSAEGAPITEGDPK